MLFPKPPVKITPREMSAPQMPTWIIQLPLPAEHGPFFATVGITSYENRGRYWKELIQEALESVTDILYSFSEETGMEPSKSTVSRFYQEVVSYFLNLMFQELAQKSEGRNSAIP